MNAQEVTADQTGDGSPPPVIVIRLVARADAVPAMVRLRRALKALDRSYGFRCIDVQAEVDESQVRRVKDDSARRTP